MERFRVMSEEDLVNDLSHACSLVKQAFPAELSFHHRPQKQLLHAPPTFVMRRGFNHIRNTRLWSAGLLEQPHRAKMWELVLNSTKGLPILALA